MNQEKIGKFIAECRKEKNLTQVQLAEILNMSYKSISKWETGRGMPDSSIMLELCEALGISVNELLSGEHLIEEQYKEKANENIINIAKESDKNRKTKIILTQQFRFSSTYPDTYIQFCHPSSNHPNFCRVRFQTPDVLQYTASVPLAFENATQLPG